MQRILWTWTCVLVENLQMKVSRNIRIILNTSGLGPKSVYLRSPQWQLIKVKRGAQLHAREPGHPPLAPPRVGVWQRGRKPETDSTIQTMEATCLHFINRPKAQDPRCASGSPSSWGRAHPSLDVLREPLQCVPSILESAEPLLLGPQASH